MGGPALIIGYPLGGVKPPRAVVLVRLADAGAAQEHGATVKAWSRPPIAPTSSCAATRPAGSSSCCRSPTTARSSRQCAGSRIAAFDWDTREWRAPVDDWVAVHVADVLARFPELTASEPVAEWLRGIDSRWVGRVSTVRHDGRGWWALTTRAGNVPAALLDGSVEHRADERSSR